MTDYEHVGDFRPVDRNSIGLALTFLCIGLGAGALVALLLAPKTGKQIRRELRRRYEDACDTFDDWSDQASDMIEKGTGWANEAKKRVAPLGKVIRKS